MKNLMKFLETCHASTRRTHHQHIRLATISVLEEVRLAPRAIKIGAYHNVEVCPSSVTTSNEQFRCQSTAAAKLGNIKVATAWKSKMFQEHHQVVVLQDIPLIHLDVNIRVIRVIPGHTEERVYRMIELFKNFRVDKIRTSIVSARNALETLELIR